MSDLEELKKKRLEELQNSRQEVNDEAKLQQQIAQLENMMRPLFSKEALQRYGNLKIAHPEMAIGSLVALSQIVQSGKLKTIDDKTFKTLLMRMQKPKREINITRK